MRSIKIRRGLNLPITGAPAPAVEDAPPARSVAVLGRDAVGLRPTMAVAEGDRVKLGQLLFTDKRNAGVRYTAPGAGTVTGVNRGAKRVLLSVTIALDGDEAEAFPAVERGDLAGLSRERVRDALLESGLWTALRTRPWSKAPAPDGTPAALFVTAMDTQPLAMDPAPLIRAAADDFRAGLGLLAKLTDGPVYLCQAPGEPLPGAELDRVEAVAFAGPHPAGLAGTHIHFLHPVHKGRTVWHVGWQDVVAVARLLTTGRLPVERVVALTGPAAARPRIVKTRLGASVADLLQGEPAGEGVRAVSGSALAGHTAAGPEAYLGRFHQQVTLLAEGTERDLMGWTKPGFGIFSVTKAFASGLRPGRKLPLTTSLGGGPRSLMSIGSYEKVMPLDVEPTHLLRAIVTEDTDEAVALGALELDEEDLALCSVVCPGKYEYGPILRRTLELIEKEG